MLYTLENYMHARDLYARASSMDAIKGKLSSETTRLGNNLVEIAKYMFNNKIIEMSPSIPASEIEMVMTEIDNYANGIDTNSINGARVRGDKEIYANELTKLFKHHHDNGTTYAQLMKRAGNHFDYDKTVEIMEFFADFKSDAIVPEVDNAKNHIAVDDTFYNYVIQLGNKYALNMRAGKSNHQSLTKYFNGTSEHIAYRVMTEDRRKTVGSIRHEIGHALFARTVVGEVVNCKASLSLHEAHAFINQFHRVDGHCGTDQSMPNKSENRVFNSPHFYNAHISVRYEFEKEMLREPNDDPQKLMNEISNRILGHDVDIMVDPHWAMGSIGYFPAYTVGHVIAAQLAPYSDTLFDLDNSTELAEIERISGKPLSVDDFVKLYK